MIHRDYKLAKVMISNNFSFIHYHNLFDNMLEVLMDSNISQICISNQDWNKMTSIYPKITLLSDFKIDNTVNLNKNDTNKVKKNIIDYVKKLIEIDNIDSDINLTNYGIDSMMAMEFSNWLKETLSFNISQLQILQGITINEVLAKSSNVINNKDSETLTLSKIKKFKKKINISEVNNELLIINEEDGEDDNEFVESNNNHFLNIGFVFFLLSFFIYYFIY